MCKLVKKGAKDRGREFDYQPGVTAAEQKWFSFSSFSSEYTGMLQGGVVVVAVSPSEFVALQQFSAVL